jgi:magnesium-transporting ATPase (P-type)
VESAGFALLDVVFGTRCACSCCRKVEEEKFMRLLEVQSALFCVCWPAGTEVAKEAADIVIMDDNFSSIVK